MEVETTFARIDVEKRTDSGKAEEATSTGANSTTLDEPHLEDISLPQFFEFELDTLADAEITLIDPAAPTLDEAPLTFTDQDVLRTPPSREGMPTATEFPSDDVLTSSDMIALEDLEASNPPEHLTLELRVPALAADPASSRREDATSPPPDNAAETAAARLSTDVDPGLTTPEAVPLEDLDESAFSGHLTLDLDSPEMTAQGSSITLDNPQLGNPPDDLKSKMSPLNAQGDEEEEEELLLDLDDLAFEDDKPM
jgi:hypothetical protein